MAISWDGPEELCLTPSSGSTRNLHAAKARLGGSAPLENVIFEDEAALSPPHHTCLVQVTAPSSGC